MYTQCTHCRSAFEVRATTLRARNGKVRCAHCHGVFNALLRLHDEDPHLRHLPELPAPSENDPLTDAGHPEGEDRFEVLGQPGVEIPPPEAGAGLEAPEWAADVAAADTLPEPEYEPERRVWRSTLGWALATVLLLGAFTAQVGYFFRNDLAQYAELRPALELLCRPLQCTIPLQRDTSRIEFGDRYIGSHPDVPGALLITATLYNRAPFRQPFPTVELKLFNLEAKVVAARRFAPREYLSRASEIEHGMEPTEPVPLRLEVVDPGEDAVAFEFDFR